MNNQREQSRALATVERLAPMRLPVSENMLGQLGVTEAQYRVLIDQIFPGARTVEAISLALAYCRSRNLDIMKKPVHVVPMWSSSLRKMVETVWPSISEIRTTATRTGDYGGIGEADFGPVVEGEFVQKITDDRDPRNDREQTHKIAYPAWCRLVVHRWVHGERCAFHARVFWTEAYATIGRGSDVPNEMWRKRPYGQLEKCTEAAALRKAFPEELGNTYAAEEMEGRTIEGEISSAYAVAEPPRPKPPPDTDKADNKTDKADIDDQVIDVDAAPDFDDPWDGDNSRYFDELRDRMEQAPDPASVAEVWDEFDPLARFEGSAVDQEIAVKIRNLRLRHIEQAAGKGERASP